MGTQDNVISISVDNNDNIFSGGWTGLYKSTNNGENWVKTSFEGDAIAIATHQNGKLYAYSFYKSGLFSSNDNGNNWKKEYDLSGVEAFQNGILVKKSGEIFLPTNTFLLKSVDEGLTWKTATNSSLNIGNIYSITSSPEGTIYAGNWWFSSGIVKSTDNGLTWIHSGIFNEQGRSILYYDSQIFLGTEGNGIYCSSDNGTTWNKKDNGIYAPPRIQSICKKEPNKFFIGSILSGVYYSDNNGKLWKNINNNLPNRVVWPVGVSPSGEIYVGTEGGLYKSTNDGDSWKTITNSFPVRSMVFKSSDLIFVCYPSHGIHRSTNGGVTWSLVNDGLPNVNVVCLQINKNGELFAATTDSGVFKSTNNGDNWISVLSEGKEFTKIKVTSRNLLLVACTSNGLYRSTDNGLTWQKKNNGLTYLGIRDIDENSKGEIFLFTDDGIYKSSDNCEYWEKLPNLGSENNNVAVGIVNSDDRIITGKEYVGVFYSLYPTVLNATFITTPPNSATNISLTPTLTWIADTNAKIFSLQVSTDLQFQSMIINQNNITSTSYQISSSLIPNTKYYWRVQGSNICATSDWSEVSSFTTVAVLPTASTTSVGLITSSSATLKGNVNPNETETNVWFQYGLSDFDNTVIASPSSVNGSSITSVSANISGLLPYALYKFRIKATNNSGTVYSNSNTFRTDAILPTLTTGTATNLTSTTATLNASVNSNGAASSVWFEYGTSSDLSSFKTTSEQSVDSNRADVSIKSDISNLSPNSIYYFRIVAKNVAGEKKGAIKTFNLGKGTPTVTTLTVTSLTKNSATLAGIVNPNGIETTAWFEYGVNSDLSAFTKTPEQGKGSGKSDSSVKAEITNLNQNTTYYYRIAAKNSAGEEKGTINNFLTGATSPTATTKSASSITLTSSILNGTINPGGNEVTIWFEYGTDNNLATYLKTQNQVKGSGTADINVSEEIKGLSPLSTYYYRLVGKSIGGENRGTITSFTTTVMPSATTSVVTNLTMTSATLSGTVNPNGSATTAQFEYGTSSDLSSNTKTQSQSIGSGTNDLTIYANLTGLSENTKYYYRVTAQNSVGPKEGSIVGFTTKKSYPSTLSLSKTIYFPTYSNTSDYKVSDYCIIGLPGKSDLALTNFLIGTYGTDWKASWDNGNSQNYKIKYDGSSEFKFFAGRAFWILKKGPLIISQVVPTTSLNTNGEAEIDLHSGWNLITNPFLNSISWSKIKSANNNLTDPIYKYSGKFDTSSTFDPFEGYYFDNRNNLVYLNPTCGKIIISYYK